MEIVAELRSREDTVKKAAAALGLNAPTAEDVIKREDYPDDITYTVALARMQKEMDTPQFRAAMRKTGVAVQREDEKQQREREREEYRKILKDIKLEPFEIEQIDDAASKIARSRLAEGRIKYSELGNQIAAIAEELTAKKKAEKASSIQINRKFRGEIARNTFTE